MGFLPKRAEGLWIFFSWIVGGVWGFFVVGVFFNKMLFLCPYLFKMGWGEENMFNHIAHE